MNIFDFLKTKKKVEISYLEIIDKSLIEINNSKYSEEEMDRNYLFKEFDKLDKNIVKQDDLELNGEGTCIIHSGRARYAHIKFKFYISKKNNSEIVWNINEEKLPNDYRINVNKVANLFIDYIEKERKDLKKFTFEIIDGSYHPTDSNLAEYYTATFYAILNSFDEELHKPNLDKIYKAKIKEPIKWVNYKNKK
jgi:hypothetical protein